MCTVHPQVRTTRVQHGHDEFGTHPTVCRTHLSVYRTPTSAYNTCTTRTRRVQDTPNRMQHTPTVCRTPTRMYNTDTRSARHTQLNAAHTQLHTQVCTTRVQHGHAECMTHLAGERTTSVYTTCAPTSAYNTCTTRTRQVQDTPGRRT